MSPSTLRPALLLAVLAAAAVVRVSLALASPNLFWPDEIFQTIEPAHRLVFGNGIRSFEWRIGLRSPVLPGALAAVICTTAPLGPGSTGYLAGLVVVLSVLSLWPIAAAARIGALAHGRTAAILALVLTSVWFDLVYFAPKALSEVIAAHVLVPAVAIAMGVACRRTAFWAACLLGLAVAIRVQLLPGATVAWLWVVWRARASWAWAVAGALTPLLVFGIVDWIAYGRPFHSFVVNVRFNMTEARSLDWGWLPKHYYAVYLWNTWTAPVAVAFGLLWLVGLRRALLPGLVAVAIIASHSWLGHKEYRFVYPALPLLLAGIATGASVLVERVRSGRRRMVAVAIAVAFAAASFVAGNDFHRHKTPTGLGDRRARTSHWTAFGDELRAARDLATRGDVLGVAFLGVPWQYSGGYTWLHHDVPLFFVDHPATPAPAWPHVNYAVANGSRSPPGFVEVARYGEVRVLRRPGDVVGRPGYDVDDVLQGR
jgi:hypothetical protein